MCREALAAKAAAEAIPTFNMIDDVIRAVAEYLGRSSPWHQRFMELQEVFTSTNLEVQGIHELDYPLVHAQILRTTSLLESRYIDYGDDFGGGPNERLYRFIEKHGPKGSPEMVVEGASSDGSLNRFKVILHERRVANYLGPGHHDACVALCADMAELLVQQLQSKLGDLDSLSGVRLFIPDLWQPNWERHAWQAQCLEWLLSLVTLFRADGSDEILPGQFMIARSVDR
ncbi:unnamed protein product [Closterium sp. Naga37s-1]|nr:unnamed protein product [Closterium sp. Naga37s-1]